jgi:hypothetical protein
MVILLTVIAGAKKRGAETPVRIVTNPGKLYKRGGSYSSVPPVRRPGAGRRSHLTPVAGLGHAPSEAVSSAWFRGADD